MTVLALQQASFYVDDNCLVDTISLHIKPATITCIVGPNGAGKTSVLHLMSGLYRCASGQVIFNGKNIQHVCLSERAQNLAVLPQFSQLQFPFMCREVVAMGRLPHSSGTTIDHRIVEMCMQRMDLLSLAERIYTQCSGGEKQRVHLARVMAQIWPNSASNVDGVAQTTVAPKNSLLILDEPTSALDLHHQKMALQQVRQLADLGVAIVMVVHDINIAAAIADQIVALKNGKLAAVGDVDKILQPSFLSELYDLPIDVIRHPKTQKPLVVNSF